jgi:hypothetical protein
MSWDVELQRKLRKILQNLDNHVTYRHFKFFEKCPIWNLSPNATSLVQPVNMGVITNLKVCVTQSW